MLSIRTAEGTGAARPCDSCWALAGRRPGTAAGRSQAMVGGTTSTGGVRWRRRMSTSMVQVRLGPRRQ